MDDDDRDEDWLDELNEALGMAREAKADLTMPMPVT
jgi:hypothetical protein